jgi:antitoxin component of MazEF toxin-antitoxin module
MTLIRLKVARIGNSRGIRIPASTLARYHIGDELLMEERSDGILLRPRRPGPAKLSWEATADAMAAASEDWADWDPTAADGLESLSWSSRPSGRVSEPARKFSRRVRSRGARKKR